MSDELYLIIDVWWVMSYNVWVIGDVLFIVCNGRLGMSYN